MAVDPCITISMGFMPVNLINLEYLYMRHATKHPGIFGKKMPPFKAYESTTHVILFNANRDI